MVRLEPESELTFAKQLRSLRKSRPRSRRPFRSRWKRGCCLFLLFLLLGLGLVVLAALSRIGLIDIPVFSPFFYQPLQPTRLIEVAPGQSFDLATGFKANPAGLIEGEITEEQLTLLLRQFLAGQPESYFAPTIQAVITPQTVEIFGLLLQPIKTNVTLDILPAVAGGQLVLSISQVQIGGLSLPPAWLDKLIGGWLTQATEALNQSLGSLGRWEQVSLVAGKIILSGQLN